MTTSYADAAHFDNYEPDTFGWPHAVPDLVPLTFDGVNFGQCARAAHPVFIALMSDLVPHIQGGLKAGSCWAYSTTDDLPDGSWSFHRYGIAIDINWNVNHMGTDIPDATGQWAIPRGIATAVAARYGCEWGGNWSGGYHDLMHFEVHLSPTDAAKVKRIGVVARVMISLRSGFPYSRLNGGFFGPPDAGKKSHSGNTPAERTFITLIQQRLAQTGDAPTNGTWKPDGKYGPATVLAVAHWQKRTGRNVTGHIASSDWKALTK